MNRVSEPMNGISKPMNAESMNAESELLSAISEQSEHSIFGRCCLIEKSERCERMKYQVARNTTGYFVNQNKP